MKKIILIAGLILLIAGNGQAEPTPKISYLMNEPASLFDLGMFALNEQLRRNILFLDSEPKKWISKGLIWAYYDWDKNRIKIFYRNILDNPFPGTKDESKNKCKDIMVFIKLHLFVDGLTGKFFLGKENSSMADLFGHFDYTNKNEPKGLSAELDNITEISVFFPYKTKNKEGHIRCTSPLLSKEVSFIEK